MSQESAFCNAVHDETGAECELPPGHTQNHRGQFDHGIAQWPIAKPSPSAVPIAPQEAEPTPTRPKIHVHHGADCGCTICEPTICDRCGTPILEEVLCGDCHDDDTVPAARLPAEARPSPTEPNGWQPIETAPKDREVLLYGPSPFGGQMIAQGAWNRGGAMHMPHWMGGIQQPTHWMPLPASPSPIEPPSQEGAEKNGRTTI